MARSVFPPRFSLQARSAKPAEPLTLAPGLDIEPETLARWTATFAHPGETVVLDRSVRFATEGIDAMLARHDQFSDRELVVTGTRVTPLAEGGVTINHTFAGFEGEHNAKCFMDQRGYEHAYGVLIQRAGQAWFVPLDDKAAVSQDLPPQPVGPARPLTTEMGRYARYSLAAQDPATYLAEHDAEPATGEFVMFPNADGTRELAGSTWMSSASPAEIAAAEGAIALALADQPGTRP